MKRNINNIELEKVLNIISRLEGLIDLVPADTPEYEELLLLISRAEKQRDVLYQLDAKGEHFVNQVNEFLES